MIRIGVIGYGYWGPNLVRNFMERPETTVTMVADGRPDRVAVAQTRYPTITGVTDARELIRSPQVDAVVIATPVSSHADLARQALEAGKHVLVEKPIASTSEDARQLVELAAARKLVLMVDHTFVYTGAVRMMRDLIARGEIGDVYYYDSVRVNLGLFQHDVSVLWDLAVHDLSIVEFLFNREPVAVSATGAAHVPGAPVNTAYLTVYFDDRFLAHIHVNWLSPVKLRQTMIGGSKKMIVWDDLNQAEKIKIYDKGVDLRETPVEETWRQLIGYRTGDMHAPNVPMIEALALEASHFADCITRGTRPQTPGEAGLRVVRILEAAEQSLTDRGRPVEIGR